MRRTFRKYIAKASKFIDAFYNALPSARCARSDRLPFGFDSQASICRAVIKLLYFHFLSNEDALRDSKFLRNSSLITSHSHFKLLFTSLLLELVDGALTPCSFSDFAIAYLSGEMAQ